MTRRILHLDLDAFYVEVERHARPELREVELLVVAGDPDGRGVVTSASYAARAFGIRSGMAAGYARRLCPHARFVRPSFERYRAASARVMDRLREIAPVVQPGGLDEAYLDLSGTDALLGTDLEAIAHRVRASIREATGLPCSLGGATNRLVAKMATTSAKPDGIRIVPPGAEAAFLAAHRVEDIHGIGPATAARLHRLGFRTAGDLAGAAPSRLRPAFAEGRARSLIRRAAGQDDSPVEPAGPPRSIGKEETFAEDIRAPEELRVRLTRLAEAAALRLRRRGLVARTVTVKVRFADRTTVTRSATHAAPISTDTEVAACARDLLETAGASGRRSLRLLGVALTGLDDRAQEDLFGAGERARRVSRALDRLRERHGAGIVHSGAALGPARPDRGPIVSRSATE